MIPATDYPWSVLIRYPVPDDWNTMRHKIMFCIGVPVPVGKWLRENAVGRRGARWHPEGQVSFFELEDDATLFAINFGGKLIETVAL